MHVSFFCHLCPILFRKKPAIHQPLVQPLDSGWDADEEHDFGDFLRGAHIYRDGLGVLSSHWPELSMPSTCVNEKNVFKV